VKEEFEIPVEIPVFVERQAEQKQEEEEVWDPVQTILLEQMVHNDVVQPNEQGLPHE